jgi:hypothetical protein
VIVLAAGLWIGSLASVPAQIVTHGNCSPVVTDVNGDVSIVCYATDPNAPKFRISYYRVGGVALSFLLDGLLSPEWSARLGGQQAIVDNAVAEEARAFLDQFATEIGGSNLTGVVGSAADDGPNYEASFADYAKQVDPSIETFSTDGGTIPDLDPSRWRAYYGYGRGGQIYVPDVAAARTLFKGPEWPAGYNVIYRGPYSDEPPSLDGETLSGGPFLWRWLRRDDLDGFEAAYRQYAESVVGKAFPSGGAGVFDVGPSTSVGDIVDSGRSGAIRDGIDSIRYLGREGLPDRFMMVEGWFGLHYGWRFTSTPRDFQLLIAVVENIAERPIEIGSFTLRETTAMTLRHNEESNLALGAAEAVAKRVYPLGVLKPGEKIVLPVRIELPQSDIYGEIGKKLRTAARRGERVIEDIRARGNTPIAVKDGNRFVLFQKPAASFPPQTVPDIVERFEYGPAWRIDSVEVDGTAFEFRQHDPNNFVMIAGVGVGSCPYVFTYQPDGKLWWSEGYFLYDAISRDKKRREEKKLERFNGRVSIRELEHEVTVLDMVNLKLEDANGTVAIYKPKRAVLAEADGEELLLGYGDTIELDFGLTEPAWRGKSASLIAVGYYVPLSSRQLVSAAPE